MRLRSELHDMYILLASLAVLGLDLIVRCPRTKKRLGVHLIASAEADEYRAKAHARSLAELSEMHKV